MFKKPKVTQADRLNPKDLDEIRKYLDGEIDEITVNEQEKRFQKKYIHQRFQKRLKQYIDEAL